MPKTNTNCYSIYHPLYKKKLKMIKSIYNLSFIEPICKQIFLFGASFHFIVKVINPLHNISKTSTIWFAIDQTHYKNNPIGNPNLKLVQIIYIFHLIRTVSWQLFFAYDSSNHTTKPNIITKKKELLQILLYYF